MFGKGVFLLVFVFLLMMYILVATTNSMLILQQKASLQVLQSPVQVQKKGTSEWSTVQGMVYVTAGDRVRTGTTGQAELRWVGATRIFVEPHTTLLVQRSVLNRQNHRTDSVFHLYQGQIEVRVARRIGSKGHFQVRTATAAVAVKGTVFSVSVIRNPQTQTEETQVEVFWGRVEVQGLSGRQPAWSLQSQQRLVMGPHIFHPTPTRLGPEDLHAWEEQEVLKPYLHVPALTLPRRTRQSQLTLTGETEPLAAVMINRQPVRVDSRGKFSRVLKLEPGVNEIEVVARDQAGYTKRVKKTVVRVEAKGSESEIPASL